MSIFLPLLLLLSLGGCLMGEQAERYASGVEIYEPGPDVDPGQAYANPTRALGPPDGRTVALPRGASLTVRFFRPIPDGPGGDLRIIEVGPDGAMATIEVSADGNEFAEFSSPAAEAASTTYDLEGLGLDSVSFVRVSGLDDLGTDPGFDLDAVEALH